MTVSMHWRAAVLMLAVLPAGLLAGPARASAARGPGTALAAAGTISTLAGGPGGPGKGTSVGIGPVCGVAAGSGHFYASDARGVRQVEAQTGMLSTPAGTESLGPLGDGGPATAATVQPLAQFQSGRNCGLAVDKSGNLLISDGVHGRVRVMAASTGTFYGQAMTAGDIYTVAGGGTSVPGDGGPARKAKLSGLAGLAVDQAGNLVIADTGNSLVQVVAASPGTFYGQAMTAGDIYTVAGGGSSLPGNGGPARSAEITPAGVTVDAAGNLVIADTLGYVRVVAAGTGTFFGQAMTAGDIYGVAGNGKSGFSGDGGPAASAKLHTAQAVAVDGHGNVLIADTGNGRIRVAAASTATFYGQQMTAGDIYTIAGNTTSGFSGDGGPARQASFCRPMGVTVDGSGNLVIADFCNGRARVVAATTGKFYGQQMAAGDVYTVAGNGFSISGFGIPATRAELSLPGGVAVDGTHDVMNADFGDNRVRVVPASTGTLFGRAMTAGDIYVLAGDGTGGFSGDGGPGDTAEINSPGRIAVDGHGNVLIADGGNNRIRVVAASTATFYGQAMTAGDIYTISGNGTAGYSGDGGPATAAELSDPTGLAVDGAGDLVIGDAGNARVRVVAASTGTFYGQPMTAGDIYTISGNGTAGYSGDGGPATQAELCRPGGEAVDGSGNVVISDSCDMRVRVVAASTGTFYGQPMTAGNIYTAAGTGLSGYNGDGGPATTAKLSTPEGVAVDDQGNLVIADADNNRIRVVAASTGTFYGQPMTAGDIYTAAGKGAAGFAGDGGPATGAELSMPHDVALTGQGGLVIADGENNRIRAVTPPA